MPDLPPRNVLCITDKEKDILLRAARGDSLSDEEQQSAQEALNQTGERPTFRSPDQIQKAHDLLTQVLVGEVTYPFRDKEATRPLLNAHAATLCWVMDHDQQDRFRTVLNLMSQALQQGGYSIEAIQERAKDVGLTDDYHSGRIADWEG